MQQHSTDRYLREVIRLSEEMLSLASSGDSCRQDVGCGIVFGALRDKAYKMRRLAATELQKHASDAEVAGFTSHKRQDPNPTERGIMSTSKTILIVDDEADVRTYLKSLFEDQGYQTLIADDGKEALEQVRQGKPDLITLDITMPEQSGVRTYRDLKEDASLATIPVVVVTAVGDPMQNFLKTRRHQVPEPEGFMAKPIDPDTLLAMVGELLA